MYAIVQYYGPDRTRTIWNRTYASLSLALHAVSQARCAYRHEVVDLQTSQIYDLVWEDDPTDPDYCVPALALRGAA